MPDRITIDMGIKQCGYKFRDFHLIFLIERNTDRKSTPNWTRVISDNGGSTLKVPLDLTVNQHLRKNKVRLTYFSNLAKDGADRLWKVLWQTVENSMNSMRAEAMKRKN